ncbi:hypothetical protein DL762_000448 [Monosporascus cannonballus]|uniref:Uncharacterized protein n=1 Tax=Monosporascus cannonballus TaxID=155416 RepID=A0ABY0HMZ1_9PEZI|nr:hypothetical protein DL762_000448 [Monosporascus cannonballus]
MILLNSLHNSPFPHRDAGRSFFPWAYEKFCEDSSLKVLRIHQDNLSASLEKPASLPDPPRPPTPGPPPRPPPVSPHPPVPSPPPRPRQPITTYRHEDAFTQEGYPFQVSASSITSAIYGSEHMAPAYRATQPAVIRPLQPKTVATQGLIEGAVWNP